MTPMPNTRSQNTPFYEAPGYTILWSTKLASTSNTRSQDTPFYEAPSWHQRQTQEARIHHFLRHQAGTNVKHKKPSQRCSRPISVMILVSQIAAAVCRGRLRHSAWQWTPQRCSVWQSSAFLPSTIYQFTFVTARTQASASHNEDHTSKTWCMTAVTSGLFWTCWPA